MPPDERRTLSHRTACRGSIHGLFDVTGRKRISRALIVGRIANPSLDYGRIGNPSYNQSNKLFLYDSQSCQPCQVTSDSSRTHTRTKGGIVELPFVRESPLTFNSLRIIDRGYARRPRGHDPFWLLRIAFSRTDKTPRIAKNPKDLSYDDPFPDCPTRLFAVRWRCGRQFGCRARLFRRRRAKRGAPQPQRSPGHGRAMSAGGSVFRRTTRRSISPTTSPRPRQTSWPTSA